jgi:hypothetical protein
MASRHARDGGLSWLGRGLVWSDPGGFSRPGKFFDQIPGPLLTLCHSRRIMKV